LFLLKKVNNQPRGQVLCDYSSLLLDAFFVKKVVSGVIKFLNKKEKGEKGSLIY